MYFSHLYLSLFHDNNEAMEVDFNQNSQRLMVVLVRKRWKGKINKIWNHNIVSNIVYIHIVRTGVGDPHSVMEQT